MALVVVVGVLLYTPVGLEQVLIGSHGVCWSLSHDWSASPWNAHMFNCETEHCVQQTPLMAASGIAVQCDCQNSHCVWLL